MWYLGLWWGLAAEFFFCFEHVMSDQGKWLVLRIVGISQAERRRKAFQMEETAVTKKER